jgi:hypothetical protein
LDSTVVNKIGTQVRSELGSNVLQGDSPAEVNACGSDFWTEIVFELEVFLAKLGQTWAELPFRSADLFSLVADLSPD